MEKITSIKDLVIQMLSNGSQVTFKANNGVLVISRYQTIKM